MRLTSRYFFADPASEVCRQFIGRVFEVEEVRAIEVLASGASAQIEYTNGRVPHRTVVAKIASHLRNGGNGGGAPPAGSPGTLPLAAADGAGGWRVERHGPVLSTWQIKHELPGRIRFRNRLIHRRRGLGAAIERALARVPGIERCRANTRTATALVVFDPERLNRHDLFRALDRALVDVEHADRGAPAATGPAPRASTDAGPVASTDKPWSSGEFTVSALSLGVSGLGALFYPPLGLLGAAGKIYVSHWVYLGSIRSLVRDRTVTVDTLVTALNVVSLVYGYYFLFCLAGFVQLCTRNLLAKVKQDSRADYTDVFREQQRMVWVRVDGAEIEMPLHALKGGDLVVLAAGQTVPVDGHVAGGAATVDQHLLTGEAIPAEKAVGDPVLALTVVLSGKIAVRVEKTGADTAAAQIARVLDRTVDFKTGRQLGAERVAERLVVPAFGAWAVGWPLLGAGAGAALADAHPKYKTTLLSSVGLLNYFKLAVREGLLIKDGRTLELLNDVDTVVFDKTGTLTLAQPHVGRVYVCRPYRGDDIVRLAAGAEQQQSHPIARAILQEARRRGLDVPPTSAADYRIGHGLIVTIDGATIRVGSRRFMEMEGIALSPALVDIQARSHEAGHSLVFLAVDGTVAGALELQGTVRPEARRVVEGLRERKITSMYIISGDHEAPTRRLAAELGIEHYFAATLPENKAALIEGLQREGKVVCYVGDGINDSIAMKKSQVSVSLRGASALATETAEVILLDESLNQLPRLLDLARECHRDIRLTMVPVLLASLLCVGGVLTGSVAFYGARLLHVGSLVGGMGLAMVPLLTHRKPPKRAPRPERLAAPAVDVPIEELVIS
jgi:Cu2+-exporting ATPase